MSRDVIRRRSTEVVQPMRAPVPDRSHSFEDVAPGSGPFIAPSDLFLLGHRDHQAPHHVSGRGQDEWPGAQSDERLPRSIDDGHR